MLAQAQVDFYRENGYIGVEGVLTQEEVEDLRRVTDEFVELSRKVMQHTDQFDLEPGHTPESPKLRRLKKPESQHEVYDRTLRNDRILDIVSQLVGPDIRTIGGKLNMKSPEFGSPVEWHQDWGFYPHTNDDILEVGVAMDDMMIENGCLMVIPGSHNGPAYDHHQDGMFVGAVSESDFNMEDAVPIELKAGGISLHHVRELHGSAPNRSSRPRRLLLMGYMAVDAFPLSGIPDWNDWNSHILRGKPTNEPRLEKVPVRFPQPKHEREGSIYEVQSKLARSHYASTGVH
ncbi:MAG: phytanoyl-CoA dioxygenase family protein [Dehalococcoidia bacterium]